LMIPLYVWARDVMCKEMVGDAEGHPALEASAGLTVCSAHLVLLSYFHDRQVTVETPRKPRCSREMWVSDPASPSFHHLRTSRSLVTRAGCSWDRGLQIHAHPPPSDRSVFSVFDPQAANIQCSMRKLWHHLRARSSVLAPSADADFPIPGITCASTLLIPSPPTRVCPDKPPAVNSRLLNCASVLAGGNAGTPAVIFTGPSPGRTSMAER
jgi:hypothetical protein